MTRVAKFVLLPAKPERRVELLEILHRIRHTTTTESGTQQWVLHDVAGQPDSVAMYEIYDDHSAAAHHMQTNAPLVDLLPRLDTFLTEPATILDLGIVATLADD